MIEARVAGIPCLINVTHMSVTKGSYSHDAASDWDYYGGTEIEFEVCDRRGRPAPWLERKMTQREITEIEDLILEKHNEE